MQSRYRPTLLLVLFSLCFAVLPALAHEEPDLTKLPVGDGKLSQEPKVGYVWRCGDGGPSSNGGAQVEGPWFNGDGTYDLTKKYVVDGTEAKGMKCPQCGQETLVYQEGCLICKNCGASRCG